MRVCVPWCGVVCVCWCAELDSFSQMMTNKMTSPTAAGVHSSPSVNPCCALTGANYPAAAGFMMDQRGICLMSEQSFSTPCVCIWLCAPTNQPLSAGKQFRRSRWRIAPAPKPLLWRFLTRCAGDDTYRCLPTKWQTDCLAGWPAGWLTVVVVLVLVTVTRLRALSEPDGCLV
jgi:hypothetical protein